MKNLHGGETDERKKLEIKWKKHAMNFIRNMRKGQFHYLKRKDEKLSTVGNFCVNELN